MDVFSKLGFEKLTESVLGKRGVVAKHSAMEVFSALSSSATFVVENALPLRPRLPNTDSVSFSKPNFEKNVHNVINPTERSDILVFNCYLCHVSFFAYLLCLQHQDR